MHVDVRLKELATLFLKLGFIGFGGPAAHISMMKEEVVAKRNWFSEQHYLDLVGATNLIPGPNSTEMAIHIGYEKAGWKGLMLAGLCFILPAVLITGLFAWLYKQYGQLPEVQPFVYGIKPAILAVILGAIFPLAKTAMKSTTLAGIGLSVLVGALLNINEVYLLFGAGFLAVLLATRRNGPWFKKQGMLPVALLNMSGASLWTAGNAQLFWIFLKIGSILYGSGYVLFAFLDTELVSAGLLTRQQLIDAIAVGQFTPGPVFSSVTFIGYQINGLSGAIVSTLGIFLPSFVFVALLQPMMKKLRNSPAMLTFLDAVNVASVAIMLAVCISMATESVTDWRTIVIAGLSMVLTFGPLKINSALLVLGSSLMGFALTQIG